MGFDEQEYTKSFDIRSWKKLLPFLRPYRGLVAVVLALNVFCAVIDIALPLFRRGSAGNDAQRKNRAYYAVYYPFHIDTS